jgi:hypothetical protein
MMSDDYKATFVVESAPEEVWKALTERTVVGETDGDAQVHYVLPGFPSLTALPIPGASCTPLEVDTGRLLRLRKDHEPCKGTEIAVQLEHAETGTRVTVIQSGFGAFLDFLGKDVVFGHGDQIMIDLRLYLARGLTVPGATWGVSLGAKTRQQPIGLELESVMPGGFAENAGLQSGDLLVMLRGVRIYDTTQLMTVTALTDPGAVAQVTWIRGREEMLGEAAF